ncbi:hypothetical protein AAFF_G00266880 [Aldrovandia affinis]|uniref:Uncharacterized protein n=1 Tax=Aldrovandia affinis TaxID=143900 RepID=A0AAD7W296_9TELE|nr:hypothetical protein AAFF_G00266880 [Aldrovandia affinis]
MGGLFGNHMDPFSLEPSSPVPTQVTSQRPLQFSESRPGDAESPPDSVFLPNTQFFPTAPPKSNTNNNNLNNNVMSGFAFEREGSIELLPADETSVYLSEDSELCAGYQHGSSLGDSRDGLFSEVVVRTDATQFPYVPTRGSVSESHDSQQAVGQTTAPATDQLIQEMLADGGLGSLARDPKFVAVAKQEMADAMLMDVEDMEGPAWALLNGRKGRMANRKKRAAPTPPSPHARPQGPPGASRL